MSYFPSVLLYYIMGFLFAYFIHKSKSKSASKKRTKRFLFFLFVTLVIFATIRKVAYGIGGTDALNYEELFKSNLGGNRFEEVDILFGYFTKAIRTFTDNPVIYRFICYSIIAFGYVYYIFKVCPKGISCIPFLMMIWPYIKSFNTMRSSIAVSVFLIGLVFYKERKFITALIILLATVFIHRMSVLYLPLVFFLRLVENKNIYKKGRKTMLILIGSVILSYFLARLLQYYLLATSLLETDSTADNSYIAMSVGKSIFDSWPMFLPHLLLYIFFYIQTNKIPKDKNTKWVIALFYYDLLILPASIVLGIWRASEFLYLNNTILWAILIRLYSKRCEHSTASLVKLVFVIAFSTLLFIRISHEWDECSILPYVPIWD